MFISSCSRRELARRRPGRALPRAHVAPMLLIFLVALAAVFAARGGF